MPSLRRYRTQEVVGSSPTSSVCSFFTARGAALHKEAQLALRVPEFARRASVTRSIRDYLGVVTRPFGNLRNVSMEPEERKSIVQQFYDQWNSGAIDFKRLVHPDVTNHAARQGSRDGARQESPSD